MFPSPGGADPPRDNLFAGRYAIDGKLPWGGLASYYRASTEGAPVVLCVLPMNVNGSKNAQVAFSRMAQSLGLVHARTVPKVLDTGVVDGVPYLVFEDTRGSVLADVLNQQPLHSRTVLRVGAHVLDALGAGHRQGLVHADITPQNVILWRDRNGGLGAKLIGLGVAPLLRAFPDTTLQTPHAGSGQDSVAYMAPELFGRRSFEQRADLYSVGALLHHMVTGTPPVGWESNEAFDDIPGLPDVVRRAMEKQPHERYSDARSMMVALEWLEIESAQRNPQTQDIAPWMEGSRIGSIPVPAIASSLPPQMTGSHPPGTVLASSGARRSPMPTGHVSEEHSASWAPFRVPPVGAREANPERTKRWYQIALLLLLLASLFFTGLWWKIRQQSSETPSPIDAGTQTQPSETRDE